MSDGTQIGMICTSQPLGWLGSSGDDRVSSTALVTIQLVFTDAERLALAGLLAGYRGLTKEAYVLDLRQFTRELDARSRGQITVTRRLWTIVGFYKSAVRASITSRTPSPYIATSSAPCWSLPGLVRRASMR